MNKKMRTEKMRNRRIANVSLIGIAVFLFLIFSYRFYQIMIHQSIMGVNLKEELSTQTTVTEVIPAKRGTIFDSNKQTIAVDAKSYALYAVLTDQWSKDAKEPNYVADKNYTALALSEILPLTKDEILDILSQPKNQVEFGNAGSNLSVETKEKIEALHLPGIEFSETPSRFYSNGVFASHLVGYTETEKTISDKNESTQELVGKMGIESQFNDILKGTNGEKVFQKDGKGTPILNSERLIKAPKNGNNIYLTIDKKSQAYLESLMSQADENYEPLSMAAMLVDAKTGNILAATQRPTFNATTKKGINKKWNNLLTDEAFEPGSTMKVLALAAAINEGVFDPNEMYQSGSIKIYKDLVSDYNKVGWGRITYLEGLSHSSNVAFVNIVQKIGVEKWHQYLNDFGFAKSTESGNENETAGENPYDSYLQQLSTGFGQGITVTVYQLLQAFTAIVNDGEMMKLRLVDRIENPDTNEETTQKAVKLGRVISPEAAKKTLDFLHQASLMKDGTATGFMVSDKLAIKTGTAELINPQTGKYYSSGNNYIFSVVAFLPSDNPQYIFYLNLKQPQSTDSGLAGAQMLEKVFNPFVKRTLDSIQR